MSDSQAFEAPSGQLFNHEDLELITALEKNKTIEWSDSEVVFNSGFKSLVYFRGRNDLSHKLPLLRRVAEKIEDTVLMLPKPSQKRWNLIGIPTAGTQLAQAAADLTVDHGVRGGSLICFSTMRSVLKSHGKDNLWVGQPELELYSYATVENVLSTAKAMLENLERLEQDGYPTKEMDHIVFATWDLGGAESLAEAGYDNVHVVYHMLDIIAAYVQLGMWPRERYDEMERRIKEWRQQHG